MKLMTGALGLLLCTGMALADPCGMVPPISLDGGDSHIERVGEQRTYVFRKGDVQTLVIHPGFTGNVDEFGMLIPFPTVPALRKVGEKTFDHLAAAVEPPVIDFYMYPDPPESVSFAEGATGGAIGESSNEEDRLVVLKEEAVGMYEVAVLEAGSAAALKRWMTDHEFRFPDGMEPVCEDYVKDGWCFVAVKTRVGTMRGAQPRPGMRNVSTQKPKDAVFDGKVQAMGFRFRSPEFEVPMRLSAFNGDDLYNVVYILAEEPVRAANLPADFVETQVSGEKLYSNLTDLLPYRLVGGTEDDLSPNLRKDLDRARAPGPHNGIAAALFGHDLSATQQEGLTHRFEEQEKFLLDIGETLGLRAPRLDTLHNAVLASAREEVKEAALSETKSMTLTVLKGDFPIEVVANENIRFVPYQLSRAGSHVSRSDDL